MTPRTEPRPPVMTRPPVMLPATLLHLRQARDLMDRRFAEPLDLDTMATAASFSRYHFARAFRAAFGETPGCYLSRRRVERAKDLLRSANLTYRREQAARGGPPPIPGCFLMAWSRPGGGSAIQEKPPPPADP